MASYSIRQETWHLPPQLFQRLLFNLHYWAAPWFRRLVVGRSASLEFDPRSLYVEFVKDKLVLVQVSLIVLLFFPLRWYFFHVLSTLYNLRNLERL